LFQLILSTCPNKEVAHNIAQQLVTEGLAACVNMIPNVSSVYIWQGDLQCDEEVQLLIKTSSAKFDQLSARINELHPYDVVEVIALNIQQGDTHYLNWINESLK